MKKLMMLMVVCILVFTGCQKSNEVEEVSGDITVGVWGTPAELEMLQSQVDKFTEESGVNVTLKQYTDFQTEIQAELIGHTAPDVFYVEGFMLPFFSEQGVLMPLDTEKIDITDYQESLIDSFKNNGELYALPKDYSTLAIYYNKDYVDPAKLPNSYEELEAYLTELKETLPEDVCPMTINVDLSRQMAVAESGGVSIMDENGLATLTDPKIAENLGVEFDLAEKGLMCSPSDQGFGWNGEIFGNGKTALMLEGNWVKGELDTNYKDLNYGTRENFTLNGKKTSTLYTVGWGINAATENEAAAYAFIEFMNSVENQKIRYNSAGTLPPTKTAEKELGISEDPIIAPHAAAAEYATLWQGGTTLQAINTEYMNYAPSVISGDMTLEEALEKIEKEANKIIQENK